MKPRAILACLFALLALVPACQTVGPDTRANADEATTNTTASTLRNTAESWTASSTRPLSQTQIDTGGFGKQAEGQFTDLAIVIPIVSSDGPITVRRITTSPDGTVTEEEIPVYARAFSSDPTDTQISDLETGFGQSGFFLNIGNIGRQNSPVIAAYNTQQLAALEIAGVITEQQRIYGEAQLEAGTALVEILADLGLNLAAPGAGLIGGGGGITPGDGGE